MSLNIPMGSLGIGVVSRLTETFTPPNPYVAGGFDCVLAKCRAIAEEGVVITGADAGYVYKVASVTFANGLTTVKVKVYEGLYGGGAQGPLVQEAGTAGPSAADVSIEYIPIA